MSRARRVGSSLLIVSLRLFRSSYTRFWSLFIGGGLSMEYGCKDKVVGLEWMIKQGEESRERATTYSSQIEERHT